MLNIFRQGFSKFSSCMNHTAAMDYIVQLAVSCIGICMEITVESFKEFAGTCTCSGRLVFKEMYVVLGVLPRSIEPHIRFEVFPKHENLRQNFNLLV